MKFGVALTGDPPLRAQVDLALLAEQCGFDHVWCWDSHVVKHEASALLTLVATHTERVSLGTCVTNPVTRHPTVTASLFATLANLVGGERVTCGIGRGGSAIRTLPIEPATLRRLEDAVRIVRGLTAGDEVDVDGKPVRFEWATGGRVPVLVGASGPKALRLAGRVADGVILTVADLVFVDWCLEQVRLGLADAGRDGSGFRVQVAVPAFLGDDKAEARDQVRWFPAFIGSHIADVIRRREGGEIWSYVDSRPAYDYRRHGRPGGNPTAHVPDEVVDRYTIVGTAEDTVAKIRALADLGVTEVNVYLSARDPEQLIESYARDVIPAFALVTG
jgi:probable F420-dependent oxidoreductase